MCNMYCNYNFFVVLMSKFFLEAYSFFLAHLGTGEDPNEICREVRCIEMDESGADKISEPLAFSTGNAEGMHSNVAFDELESTPPRQVTETQSNMTNGILEERHQDVQMTIGSLVSRYPEDPSPWAQGNMSRCESQKLNRSWSCRATLMAGSSFPDFETTGDSQNTPVEGFEKSFPGRPEGFQRMVPPLNYDAARLSRNDSQSSMGSAFVDELKAQKNKNSTDEDIPSIDTFVAGLKEMAKLEYEKQLANCQVRTCPSSVLCFPVNPVI